MIAACKDWLIEALKEAGVPAARAFTDPAALSQHHALPFAVMVLGKEVLRRDGSRVAREDSKDRRRRAFRRRLWRRILPVGLIATGRTEGEVDGVLDGVLAAARTGPVDSDGNRYRVRASSITWEEDRSTALQRARAELPLEFEGGVFRDDQVVMVTDVAPEPDYGE